MALCNQCGKPSIVNVCENPLCVDCYMKFQQANQIACDRNAQNINFLADYIESSTGAQRGWMPRVSVPQPTISQGPMTFNNIKVDKSTIGSINTGEIKQLDIAMNHSNETGNTKFVAALKEFTEAVINSTTLDEKIKNETIEQLSFITSQSNLPKEDRKPSIIKNVLSSIKELVSTITTLSVLWDKVQPYFEDLYK